VDVDTETKLTGRTQELDRIGIALADLEGGESQLLAITGEPGIGKTRLLAELRARAHTRGHTVLAGRSTEFERESPFGTLVEALDDFLASFSARRLKVIGERLPHLTGVFPALSRVTTAESGPALERYRHHRAIRALLEDLALKRPLVLVLDDVHWADAASVEAIAYLLRRPPTAPVLLVLSCRSGQAPAMLIDALAGATREARAEHLALGPLSELEAATLLAGEPDPPRRRRIYIEAGGNPFYIEQLLRTDSAPRAASDSSGVERSPEFGTTAKSELSAERGQPELGLPDQIPPAVAAALAQELRHLSPRARRMLEGAAVAGEPFEPELAAEAVGLEPELALELLDELIACDCVRSETLPRRFRFRHPIVRRAVYDSIAPGRRLAAHGRVAQVLHQLGAPAAARAHHVALSARLGDEGAIAVLEQAASQVAAGAPASSAEWLAVALSLLPSDHAERRLALLSSLAQAQAAAGRLTAAHATLVEITAGLPPDADSGWSQAVASLASVELALGRHSGAHSRLEHALAAIPDQSTPHAVPLLVALAMDVSYQGDFERGSQACVRALAASVGGDPALRALARAVLALMLELQGSGASAAARDCATLAASEFEALTDEQLAGQLDLPYHLGLVETLLERFEQAARHLQRGIAVALACGNSQFIVSTRAFLAYCLMYLGRTEDALHVADEAVETGRLMRVPAVSAWALTTAASAWSAVDTREALRLGEEALATLGDLDDSMMADTTHGHFAVICADAGQHERCIEHMKLAGAPDFERFGEPGRRCFWTEALVRSTLALGRLSDAREWAALGEELAADLGLPVAEAAVRRARAMVLLAEGESQAAAELALAAAAGAAAHGTPIEAARSRSLAGRALAAAGQPARAITELHAARAELLRCGARRLEQEVARELRALGVSAPAPVSRRPGDTGTRQLSRREREVATRVAAGESNPEIAAALYLSPKTIEGHMRRIFEKLDVSSRAQVAATIAREESRVEPATGRGSRHPLPG
jgi:DNA-binding NarL/FixJ family response regulator/tetratricopeptide (TPR) repeat protein